MKRSAITFLLLIFALNSAVFAQTVQLPTVQIFSIGTTVVVPDRGSAFLGGVDRVSMGSDTFGVPGFSKIPGAGRLFTNQGIGKSVSSSSAWASATIIDHTEIDRAILEDAAASRDDPIARKAAFLSQHISRRPTDLTNQNSNAPRLVSNDMKAMERQVGLEQKQRAAEASDYLIRGQQAESNSKPGVAKIYYQMASRRATGDTKRLIEGHLARLSQNAAAPVPRVAKK